MNLRSILVIIILMLNLFSVVVSQTVFRITEENADCRNFHELFDSVWGPTTPPNGYGEIIEVSGDAKDLYAFEIEHNTVWYLFTAMRSGILSFDILPRKISDDYDFLLFRYEDIITCEKIEAGLYKPVRSCISRNDTTIGSKTGLSIDAADSLIHSGPGASYAKSIRVIKGQRFLLVLDNVYPNGDGHTINFHYSNFNDDIPEIKPKDFNYIIIRVMEDGSFTPVPAQIILNNKSLSSDSLAIQSWQDTSMLFLKVNKQTRYELKVKADGYFLYTTEIKTGSGFQTYRKTAILKKIEEGKSVSFNDILFYGGLDRILRESYPVLEDIVETLTDQEGFKIKIIGHVNAPYNQIAGSSKKAQHVKLSEDRAKAVYNYLVKQGIDPQRLSWEGKSNTEMIYPYATNEDQMQANRRVEFFILPSDANQ